MGALWLGFSLGQPCWVAPQQARKICVVGGSVREGVRVTTRAGEEEAAFSAVQTFQILL